MKNISNKLDNLTHATKRLNEAVTAYKIDDNDLYRDALIQRFEFTFELAWKTLREFMLERGFVKDGFNSPRDILKLAYSENLIDDETLWLDALEARNQTSHTYDESVAIELANQIVFSFQKILNKLSAILKKSKL